MKSATMERPRLAEDTTEETAVHETNGHGKPQAEQAPTSADDAPAKDPIPAPTPDELRAIHYRKVLALGEQVQEARNGWENLKKETSDAKKEFDGMTVQLLRLMRSDPLQRELLVEPHAEFSDQPLPVDDSWRKLPVSTLDLADHIVGKLDSHAILTLGDLQDYWKSGKHLRDFKGIGEAADTAVVDAFSEYGAQHPEVFGEKPATEPTDDEPAEDDGEE